MTVSPPPRPVSINDIAGLLTWARRLSEAGPTTDPADTIAYLRAKADLLARITEARATTTIQEIP